MGLSQPGEVSVVLRVLYLIFNEGYPGSVDLAAEAIRLTRGLSRDLDDPEVAGLLALMLLHHARSGARFTDKGGLIPLDEQDRARWDTAEIAEGVGSIADLDPWSDALAGHHRLDAVLGHLQERAGNHLVAAGHYATAAACAASTAERDHLTRQAARLRSA